MKSILCVMVVWSICLSASSFAQGVSEEPTTPTGASPASKDPRAVSLLTQMLRTTGWAKATAPRDAVLSGTVTRHYPDGDVTSTVTMKLRGDSQYSYAEDGVLHAIVNGLAGATVDFAGKAHKLPAHAAVTGGHLFLPMSNPLLNWDAANVETIFVGQSAVNGESCTGIQLVPKHLSSAADPVAQLRSGAPLTLWISSTRSVPIRADYYRVAADNHTATLRETVLFSDYRAVNGVPVPFRQDVSIDEHPMLTYQFSKVEFNQGLTDSDFNVAAVLGGAR